MAIWITNVSIIDTANIDNVAPIDCKTVRPLR